MRFSIITATLGLVASALAQTADFASISSPGKGDVIEAGTTTTIKWTAQGSHTGPVTIEIIGGPDTGSLVPVDTVATGVDYKAGQAKWAVSKKLGKDKVYGVKIILESDTTIFQFSPPFSIKPVAGGTTDSATDSTTTGSSKTASSTDSTSTDSATTTTSVESSATSTPARSTVTYSRTVAATSGTPTSTAPLQTGAASNFRLANVAALGGIAAFFFTL